MNDFDAYKLYVSLKNHFNSSSYDYFKYNKKNNIKYETFQKRNDKIFFQKLAKHEDLESFLVSNFVHDNKLWVKNLAYTEQAEKVYKDWLKVQQSLFYIFDKDLSKLDENFNNNFIVKDNQHPKLFLLLLRKEITIETICILSQLIGFTKHWDKELEYDPLWKDYRNRIIKYLPFIKYDKEKFKKKCLDKFG